jgi:hypothetical protein
VPSGSSVKLFKRPRQELNLVFELRRLACEIRHTPRTKNQHPAEESNLVRQFRGLPCFHHTRRASSVPTWTRTRTTSFGGSDAFRYTIRTSFHTKSRRLDLHQHQPVYKTGASLFGHVGNQQDREESNPVKRLWRPPAHPGARSCKADPSCPNLDRLALAAPYWSSTLQ